MAKSKFNGKPARAKSAGKSKGSKRPKGGGGKTLSAAQKGSINWGESDKGFVIPL